MFKQEDLNSYRAFKRIVSSCDLSLKGNAVIMAAALFRWFESLEGKIEQSIMLEQMEPPEVKPFEDKDGEGVEEEEDVDNS